MKPLQGKSVLVTRPKEQAADLADPLEALGATVTILPAISILPLEDSSKLDAALRNLESYDWVVLTSVNGVSAVGERMRQLGISPEALGARQIAAIGPATGRAVERLVRAPDFIPSEFVAEAIDRELKNVEGLRFLLARADIARPHLAEALQRRGAIVDEVAAYLVTAEGEETDLPEVAPDYITLTSSASATSLKVRLQTMHRGDWLEKSKLVCIGPITAATVTHMGYEVAVMPSEYTIPALIDSIVADAEAVHA